MIILDPVQKELVKSIFRYKNEGLSGVTYDKLDETLRVTTQIVETLDCKAIQELSGGYSRDLEDIFDVVFEETYDVLFGCMGKVKLANLNHLHNLNNSVEETLRTENLIFFITSVLPDFEINWHHLEWGEMATDYDKAGILAARDHGKSYFWSNAFALWKMYRYKKTQRGDDPLARRRSILHKEGFLFSFSYRQAIDLLTILKDTVENSEILSERLLPKSRGNGNWSKVQITCRNGARLKIRSFGSSTRGAHPGWIVVDDGLKDNVMYSKEQRDKNKEYFQAVIMNMILPKGQVIVVGTPFHSDDLYGDLKKKVGWHVREYPSIFPDGTILWPTRYGYDDLMDKRDNQGSLIFSREHLCRPVTSESTIFPFEIMYRSIHRMEGYTLVRTREEFKKKFDKVVVGTDFSISANIGADSSVFAVFGIDEDGCMWLMHLRMMKGATYSEQKAVLKSININFRPDIIVVESNQFQVIFFQELEKEGLPVVPHSTTASHKNNLQHGLPGLAVKFETNRIKMPRGNKESIDVSDMVISQFGSITWTDKGLKGVGEHDDIPMSFWQGSLGVELVANGLRWDFI